MIQRPSKAQGFVLIAALLLLFLLSGVAVGVMMVANSEMRIGGNDKESQVAFYGAESGMEKLTSDLAALYSAKQSPNGAELQALTNTSNAPNTAMVGNMTYAETITFPVDASGNPAKPTSQLISSGPNQGLTALILPMTLAVNSLRPSNASANITRNVEVALIPVFQFGVFSDSDLSYFPGPKFTFAGRVHTNGNLFPTPNSGSLVFGDKVTAAGEIIRDYMANGLPTTSSYNGAVFMPNASNGCAAAIAAPPAGTSTTNASSNCLLFAKTNESWQNGIPGSGTTTANWLTTSTVTFNGYVGNPRSTGVKKLVLPFVQGGGSQIDIVRKPLATEAATSALGRSRLYNKANIRVLLASTLANLHPERSLTALDVEDVDLGAASAAGTLFGGTAVAYADPTKDASWKAPSSVGAASAAFPLVNGFLRVEYKDSNEIWHGITNQWLNLGFARSPLPPVAPGADAVNPNAILRLQKLADTTAGATIAGRTNKAVNTNFYPINFYDAREGEVRDKTVAGSTCEINGIMNAVEIDAGNLGLWLNGTIAGSGQLVESTDQNGYLLYFSDRRGMLPNPHGIPNVPNNTVTGEYGFEDVINVPTSTTGLPNGVDGGVPEQGEDVDGNGVLDTWGAANVGDGFRVPTATVGYPYAPIDCLAQGRMNLVTGARHVLRLIDGSLGNVPLPPGANGLNGGGFTVASENPVYVLGDYNASVAGTFTDANHSAAAILADSVTLLSNNWTDDFDMANTTTATNRNAVPTYYRMAIAAGKNIVFSNPTGVNSADWGTDGGLHNFLRYLEDWSGVPLNYNGSLVSLYYSQYATGTFKCCNTVYGAPNRVYQFDTLFLNPSNLPPGTPMFQDVVNLSYRQDFTPY